MTKTIIVKTIIVTRTPKNRRLLPPVMGFVVREEDTEDTVESLKRDGHTILSVREFTS